MAPKSVLSERWSVEDILNKLEEKTLIKPKFQRKKKWLLHPLANKSKPNNKEYIEFLRNLYNSIHTISFGLVDNKYANIDGNNRLCAIFSYLNNPVILFPEHFEDLFNFSKNNLSEDLHNDFYKYIEQQNYDFFFSFKMREKFCEENNEINSILLKVKPFLYNGEKRDEFEDIIEQIKNKLSIGGNHFKYKVNINVNLFKGFETNELAEEFENLNKYGSLLSAYELLASRLYTYTNFEISDNYIKNKLLTHITNYYKENENDESLVCYKFDSNINGFDFIVGLQKYYYEDFKVLDQHIFDKPDANGTSMLFKIWEFMFQTDTYESKTFNSENINSFIYYTNTYFDIIKMTWSAIFTDIIDEKIFNSTTSKKIQSIKKNNHYLLYSLFYALYIQPEKYTCEKISKIFERILLFHFFVQEIEDPDVRKKFALYDGITYVAGGAWIKAEAFKIHKSPDHLLNKINQKIFIDLINILLEQRNKVFNQKKENKKQNKRIKRTFFEKILFFYYYKVKVPVCFLKDSNFKLSIEHIFPYSSEWNNELSIERTGNLIPLPLNMNRQRNNKHIDAYLKGSEKEKEFINTINQLIPECRLYDEIIEHNKRCTILDNKKYNNLCDKNEKIYVKNFLEELYQ